MALLAEGTGEERRRGSHASTALGELAFIVGLVSVQCGLITVL